MGRTSTPASPMRVVPDRKAKHGSTESPSPKRIKQKHQVRRRQSLRNQRQFRTRTIYRFSQILATASQPYRSLNQRKQVQRNHPPSPLPENHHGLPPQLIPNTHRCQQAQVVVVTAVAAIATLIMTTLYPPLTKTMTNLTRNRRQNLVQAEERKATRKRRPNLVRAEERKEPLNPPLPVQERKRRKDYANERQSRGQRKMSLRQ